MSLQKILSKLSGDVLVDIKGQYDEVPVIPTGILSLDWVLGGGIPQGMITHFWGPEGGGKTVLSLVISKMAQEMADERGEKTGAVGFVDLESKLRDPRLIDQMGIDRDRFYLMRPENGDQAANIMRDLVASGELSLLVLDSVTMMKPAKAQQANSEDHQMALTARLMSDWLPTITPVLGATHTAFLVLGQERTQIKSWGAVPGPTGGKALLHAAVVECRIRKAGKPIQDKYESYGINIDVENRKNQMGTPYRRTEISFYFKPYNGRGFGVDRAKDIVVMAEALKLIEKKGSWYYYKGENLGQGEDNAANTILDSPELRADVERAVLGKNKEEGD